MRRSLPLPVDVLVSIFSLATAGCKIQDLTNLALVCTEFRNVLFTTPLLWTDLLVPFTHRTDLWKLVNQLDRLFKRARNQRVRLSLNYESDLPHREINLLNDFLLDTGFTFRLKGLSIRLSKSINFVSLSMIPYGCIEEERRILNDWSFFTHFLEIAEAKDTIPFEHLEYLSLNVLDMAIRFQSQTFRKGFPNLKVLTLNCSPRYGKNGRETINWTGIDLKGLKALTVEAFQLEHYDELKPSTNPVYIILSAAPDLQLLDLTIPQQAPSMGEPPSPSIGSILVHATLTDLVLRGRIEDIARLLPTVTLPQLRSLRLEAKDCGRRSPGHRRARGTGIVSKVEKLIRDSGCELKELVIDFKITWTEEQLAELCSLLPEMTRLTVA